MAHSSDVVGLQFSMIVDEDGVATTERSKMMIDVIDDFIFIIVVS